MSPTTLFLPLLRNTTGGVPAAASRKLVASGRQGERSGHVQPPELDGDDGRPGPDQELADIRAAQGHTVGGQRHCGAAQPEVAPLHRSAGTGFNLNKKIYYVVNATVILFQMLFYILPMEKLVGCKTCFDIS